MRQLKNKLFKILGAEEAEVAGVFHPLLMNPRLVNGRNRHQVTSPQSMRLASPSASSRSSKPEVSWPLHHFVTTSASKRASQPLPVTFLAGSVLIISIAVPLFPRRIDSVAHRLHGRRTAPRGGRQRSSHRAQGHRRKSAMLPSSPQP